MYHEGNGSEITHNGVRYDLNKLFKRVAGRVPVNESINSLDWILEFTNLAEDSGVASCNSCRESPGLHKERVNSADIEVPILIIEDEGRLVTLDGIHRLEKSILEGKQSIPVIYVHKDELEKSAI